MSWEEYNERKQEWFKEHPEATPEEIESFCKALAEELNL